MGSVTVEVGQKAPDFTMPSDEGKPVTVAKEIGKGPVVLSLYVFDFTGVCQGQLCARRDTMEDFKRHGATVFGISTDSSFSHKAFRAANHLHYPLLSDRNKIVSKSYGVFCEKIGDWMGVSKRSVFVLDNGGVVRYKWVTEDPKVPPDAKKVFGEVKKLAK